MATARDYELVAGAIKGEIDKYRLAHGAVSDYLITTVGRIAERFELQNPRFQPRRFYLACGLTEDDLKRRENLAWLHRMVKTHGHGGI